MTRRSLFALSFGMMAAILIAVGLTTYAGPLRFDAKWLMAGHNILQPASSMPRQGRPIHSLHR